MELFSVIVDLARFARHWLPIGARTAACFILFYNFGGGYRANPPIGKVKVESDPKLRGYYP